MTIEELEKKKIVIATHVYATGPAQDLLEYLRQEKAGRILFIGHPLFFSPKLKGSGYELYVKGELEKDVSRQIRKLPEPLAYIKDVLLNVFWVWKNGGKWDLFVGSDNLNAFSGIILKKLGRARKVVYYVIDYNPKRFRNRFLNMVYHKLDQFCVKHADETWNLSSRMAPARQEHFGFSGGKQKTVPIGIWFDRFQRVPFERIERHTLAFMGHVLEKQGLQYVLAAVPAIIKELPDFKFLVIGDGEYLSELKRRSAELGIEEHVEFTGYVEKHSDVETLLSRCACAVAPYEKYDQDGNLSFTYFADPGKIKSYLAAGLPVLLSDVPYNAKEIEEKGCGLVIDDMEKISEKIIALMNDEKKLERFRQNAVEYAREFDWGKIFSGLIMGSGI